VVLKLDRDADSLRFYLNTADPIESAPSIGPRTAERLERIGIRTVADFLRADPEATAERLRNRHIKADTIRQWQQQTILVCRVPQLRGHDAQILVACGIHDPEKLAAIEPSVLWRRVEPFSETNEGKRFIRNGKAPDLEEVRSWIAFAAQARPLRAA
jgi:RecG-like helicase